MSLLVLFLPAFLDTSQTVLTKMSSKKTDMKFMLSFNAFKSIGAFLTIALPSLLGFDINIPTAIFGAVYGILLLSGMCTSFIALNCGNMAMTAIIISYSLIIPFLFGGIILHEPITFLQITGLIILLISILLMNYRKKREKSRKKWFFFTFSCFITNGLCSVIQKLHQTAYPGQYCEAFMTVAFGTITLILMSVLVVKYKGIEKYSAKKSIASGACIGISYLMTLYFASVFNATVLFPTLAVFGAVLNCFASRFFSKKGLGNYKLFR